MEEKSRIGSIDFIRAISVIMIIMFHFIFEAIQRGFNIGDTYYITKYGAYGVTFFIVISGGGIFSSAKNSFSTLSFYKKRLVNILPPYWVAFVAASVFLYVTSNKITIGTDPLLLLLTITGMDGYFSSEILTYFTVGEWFVGFIILMYILFPAILVALKKSKIATLIICILVSVTCYVYNDYLHEIVPFWNKYPMFNPLIRLPEFVFGIIFFDAINQNKKNIYIFLVLALITYSFYIISGIENEYGIINIPRYISLFIICVSFYEVILARLNSINGFFIWMSKYSFMSFLFHHQIIYALGRNGNVSNLNNFSFYIGCLMTVILSYTCAIIFTPVTNNIQGYIRSKLAA